MDDRAQQARAAYDEIVDPYVETFFDELDRKPFDRELLDDFARRVGRGFVLDIGSGPGHVTRYLMDTGVQAVALDVSLAMLQAARRLTHGLSALHASMTALPVAPGRLAGIAAFYSVIHLERDALEPTFAGWLRALRPGGAVLVAFHGGEGTLEPGEMLGRNVDLTFTFYAPEEVADALANAGFTVDSTATRDPYPFEAPTRRVYIRAHA
jgi:SAM-dependent methyltransferase